MALPKIIHRPPPTRFDGLRYWVPSHTTAGKKYLVDITSFNCNGECQCKNFVCELAPLLKAGVTPARAVADGLIVLKERQRVPDALRCIHIVDGFMQFAEDAAKLTIQHAQTLLTPQAKREAARPT